MSRITRSSGADVLLAVVLAAMSTLATAEGAPPLPSTVLTIAPGLKLQGGGEFTFYGISVYDGWYWSHARGWPHDAPYALDLHYRRSLQGARIAARSVEEIAQLGYGAPEQRARWGALMAKIFPDVTRGDRLTGVYTGSGAVRYFHNDRPIGEIAEPGFARAFFGIWLDPRTSRNDFREKLLGAQ